MSAGNPSCKLTLLSQYMESIKLDSLRKQENMIMKYHNHTPQTNPRYRSHRTPTVIGHQEDS